MTDAVCTQFESMNGAPIKTHCYTLHFQETALVDSSVWFHCDGKEEDLAERCTCIEDNVVIEGTDTVQHNYSSE